jgi:branched-chain amino acid transport system permease protein
VENLVFSRQLFQSSGIGINVTPPQFASGSRAFVWLALAVFGIIALLIVNLRRSTTGLALNAVRWTTPGSKTLGISVLQMKVLVAGFAAFVAGIGGAMLALSLGVSLSANYDTLLGLVWLAVVVTLGIRSNVAALFAGLSSTLLAGVALVYLPKAFGNVPPILFGLGAIAVAKFPEGTLAMQARQIRFLWSKTIGRRLHGAPPGPPTTATPGGPEPARQPAPSTVAAAAAHPGPDAGMVSP